jgi:pimeloyl-ACP methyl ester carboxylesterase
MIESEWVAAASGKLHVRVIGSGPPVVLLHGFPDSSLGFRDLCERLAAAGFRAIAPDLKGYGLSDKPDGLEAYRVDAVLDDLRALARWAADEPITLIGHDWGGTFAYCFAERHPELVRRLVILNAAHPESFARALKRSFQWLRSIYILLFQIKGFAEWLITRRWVFRWMMRQLTARPRELASGEIEMARREFLRPGVAQSALNYYRAAMRWRVRCTNPITPPTLVVWGDRDVALDKALLADLQERILTVEVERLPRGGHFVHWDEPQAVSEHIVRFLLK